MKRGDNLNSYGEKDERIDAERDGLLDAGIEQFLREARVGIKSATQAKGTKREKYRR